MPTPRERLQDLLDELPDDRVETVLAFAEALRRGRAVVSVCDVPTTQTETEGGEQGRLG